jgi:hypothetical protein
MPDSLPRAPTYFSELFGLGYLLVGLFALAFYAICFLFSKGHIAASDSGALLATYWVASTLYFAKRIHGDFPKFYKAALRRMRLYSATRIFLQWYLGFSVAFIIPLWFIVTNYSANIHRALSDWTIRLMIGGYGITLFSVVFVGTVICNLVAESRGIVCSKTAGNFVRQVSKPWGGLAEGVICRYRRQAVADHANAHPP